MISIAVGQPEAAMIAPFEALRQRAGANAFMHPAALLAASTLGFAQIHVLRAFDDADGKLVGFWALRERRVGALWPRFLASPPYQYCFVSNPVLDPACADAVMPAFLDAIAQHADLPKVIQLKTLDGNAESYTALTNAIHARRGQMLTLSETQRPFLGSEADRKRSGSTGKKLRQDWNKLASLGAVDIANAREAGDVRAAFEVFLAMEAKSWKGANGTALLSDEDDAEFTRHLIGNLGDHRAASVALLRVDGNPIAAQVLLYSGDMAYTWKIAFDNEYAKYSPGALLIDKLTDELFAAGIRQIESCSIEGSFMANLWTGRRKTLDLLVDVGAQKSLGFTVAALGERGYAFARDMRDRLRAARVLHAPNKKPLAATKA